MTFDDSLPAFRPDFQCCVAVMACQWSLPCHHLLNGPIKPLLSEYQVLEEVSSGDRRVAAGGGGECAIAAYGWTMGVDGSGATLRKSASLNVTI